MTYEFPDDTYTRCPSGPGLYVDCGRYSPRSGRWIREPYAEYTCESGCAYYAVGAQAVARMVTAICRDRWHERHCPC